MNVNHNYKVVWWLPTRTASRSVSEILSYYKFTNSVNNLPVSQSYTHRVGVPSGCEDYTVVCNVRNPYSKILSVWHLQYFKQDEQTKLPSIGMSFKDYLYSCRNHLAEEYDIIKYPIKPNVYIHMETVIEDIKKLPFIDFNDVELKFIVDHWIGKNHYTSEGCMENHHPDFDLKRDVKNPTMTDYKNYYTQEDLDFIWNSHKIIFNEFGYQREFI